MAGVLKAIGNSLSQYDVPQSKDHHIPNTGRRVNHSGNSIIQSSLNSIFHAGKTLIKKTLPKWPEIKGACGLT